MAKLFLVLLTITALLLHEGEALKCWSCNSNIMEESGCVDPFGGLLVNIVDRNQFSKDCDSSMLLNLQSPSALTIIEPHGKPFNDSGLVIVCYILTGTSPGAPFVLRGCAASMPNITASTSCLYDGMPQNQTGGNTLTCNVCSGDFCNGAANVGSAAIMFVVTLLLLA